MKNNCNKITGAVTNLLKYHDIKAGIYQNMDGWYTLGVRSQDALQEGDYDDHTFYSKKIEDLFKIVTKKLAIPLAEITVSFPIEINTDE